MANPFCPDLNLTGFINLGVAENCLMQTELLEHIKKDFDPQRTALSYGEGPNGSARLRSTLSSFINRFFCPFTPVKAQHISVSSGVTGSIERCAFELGDPGDAFLLGRPYYGALPSEIGDRANICTIPVSFEEVDPMGLAAVSVYESSLLAARAKSQRVRALLLCSPHNPLGRCYTKEVLIALMRLCQKYSIHMIVDEVYALSIFETPENKDAPPFTSVLAIDPTGILDPALLHVLWGVSKDFGSNGLRIGCVISQENQSLLAALDAHAPYSYPAAFLEYVACLVLEDHGFAASYITENCRRLAENYEVVTAFLNKHSVPYLEGTNAGLFVWANLGAAWLRRKKARSHLNGSTNGTSSEEDQVPAIADELREKSHINIDIDRLLIAEKVYLVDGEQFGSEVPGYFRIVFTQPKDILQLGLVKIAKALEL